MDNNKNQTWSSSSSSSSSTVKFDQLFGPKDPSAASFSSIFGSIFPPTPSVDGRGSRTQEVASKILGTIGTPNSSISNKNTSTNYQNETVEPIYFSSSIHYGGQENYSSRGRTTEPHHVLKKDKNHGDPNGNNSSASRGDWWEGSLYY